MKTAELEKIHAEIAKLMAETAKLNIETTKIQKEAYWYPLVIGSGATATLIGAITLIVKLL